MKTFRGDPRSIAYLNTNNTLNSRYERNKITPFFVFVLDFSPKHTISISSTWSACPLISLFSSISFDPSQKSRFYNLNHSNTTSIKKKWKQKWKWLLNAKNQLAHSSKEIKLCNQDIKEEM